MGQSRIFTAKRKPPPLEVVFYPGKSVDIFSGETYTLRVRFVEDYRKCRIPPEETIYLLEEEKWKASKDYLPLKLVLEGNWESESSHSWVQDIEFRGVQRGDWELEGACKRI